MCLTWSETPEDTFSHEEAHMYYSRVERKSSQADCGWRAITVTLCADFWSQGLKEVEYQSEYRKNPKHSDTRKIAVIILKLEQYRFTTE